MIINYYCIYLDCHQSLVKFFMFTFYQFLSRFINKKNTSIERIVAVFYFIKYFTSYNINCKTKCF